MKDFLKKIIDFNDKYQESMEERKKNEKKAFKMPIVKLFLAPFSYLIDFFKNALSLMLTYSLFLSVVALACGFSLLCTSFAAIEKGLYCNAFGDLYLIYLVVKLFLLSLFSLKYYDVVSNKGFSFLSSLKVGKKELKVFLMFIGFLLLNLFPALSLYILYVRVPNPDWVIELLFFAIVSLGFLVPFLLMRFYSAIGYYIENAEFPDFGYVWEKTKDNSIRIVFSIFLICTFTLIFMTNFYMNFYGFNPQNVWYSAFISEFLYNIISLLVVALVIGNFHVQKQIIFAAEEDEKHD